AAAQPDIVFYLAGADPHESDRLGRLTLSFEGLARRDALVLEQCREIGIPVAVVIGGGYGDPIELSVAVHVATARIAARFAVDTDAAPALTSPSARYLLAMPPVPLPRESGHTSTTTAPLYFMRYGEPSAFPL